MMITGVLRGGARGPCPPPPYNWLRCSKLEVANQQGVVNSRSETKRCTKLKLFIKLPTMSIYYLSDKHR